MEKINIAEILKDCPRGMELDCTMWDDCTFDGIEDVGYMNILVKTPTGQIKLSKEGCFIHNCDSAKCVIFPKGKTTWEGFVPPCKFNDGDILYLKTVHEYEYIFINKIIKALPLDEPKYYKYANLSAHSLLFVDDCPITYKKNVKEIRLATEDEKQKLFDAIKAKGLKWNDETKNLEKIREAISIFKVGDKIKCIKNGNIYEIIKILSNCYIANYLGSDITILFNRQDEYKLINEPRPRFKVGDIIKTIYKSYKYIIKGITDTHYTLEEFDNKFHKFQYTQPIIEDKNWVLVPNKFDISTLKPFESRVLARDKNTEKWKSNFWGFYDIDNAMNYPYECCGNSFAQCIPYEGNEHLLGTKNDCDEYYKTW